MTISSRSSRLSRSSRGVSSALLAVVLLAFGSGSAFAQQEPQHPHPLPPPPLPESSPSSRPVPPGQIPSAPIPGGGPSASLNTSTWTALGPASLQTGGGLVSGRVAGLAVDPTDSNTIYSAAAGGGVWKTTDGGSNWTPLTDNQVTLAMGSIAVAPTNHLRIYAGTGEANNSADSDHGEGILVSSDGGATWTLETAGGAFAGTAIGQIAVDPTNADVAYAALGGYYPQNGIFASQNGIWKTTDGGATWTNLTTGVDADSSATIWSAVVVDPNTPSIIYAAIGDLFDTHGDTGIYRSTDSGTTWTLLSNGPHANLVGRIALAVSPSANTSGQHVLYVAASSTQTYGLVYFGRSDNADASTPTFTNLTSGTPNFLGGQGWYDIAVGVDSTGVVYCAGVENYNLGGQQHVLRSANLGVTWSDISIVNGFEPHTDSHAIAFDSGNRMILGSDGGVFRYDATVPSWTDLNSNLNTIQFTGIGLHPTSATSVVGGSQDNGTEVYNGNLVWTETDGGDGGFSLYSQTNPAECYSIHPVASFGLSAFFRRSSDSCSSWSSAASGISYGGANFYPPFVVDAADGNHLLLGTEYENETTNAATSWTATGSPSSNGFNSGNAGLDSIAVAPANGSNPQVIYVATGGSFAQSSHIFVTQNDGLLWTQHDLPACTINGNISAGCRVNQIVTDPNDPTGQTAVAVIGLFSASGSSHVFRTTNGGTAWTDITGNLPNVPTWSVQIDTDPSRTIYVSTDAAAYFSVSPYSTWASYGAGLPHAQGVDLELNRNLHLLGLATHGRGAWEIETPPHVTNVSTTAANGTYSAGNSIPIVITFSTAVNVTGTPQLTLDTTPNASATYASGSGTTALTFSYSVQSGQTTNGNATSGHLDYTSGAALSLNGGAIADTSGTPAVLTLYAPGAAGSLSANNSIVITGAAPTPIIPYVQVNGGAWQQVASVAVNLGDKVNLSGQNISGGSWSWTGPNSYMASTRDIYNVPFTSATNVYNLTYTNSGGGTSTQAFTITVNPTAVVPWIQVNGGVWQQVAGVAVNLGDKVNLSGQNIKRRFVELDGPEQLQCQRACSLATSP